ncbi:MAG: hypothetical protein HJJLKODD_02366 [Phycisphaerae bacterium]|nr:hypothetical protein [Phycisphaerae bacterium]
MQRNYARLIEQLTERCTEVTDRQVRMQLMVDLLWDELHEQQVSWVGFYLKDPQADQLLLGPRRDQPACSPIGLHGACGQCFLRNHPLLVYDVRELGENYIACDPRDRSEAVLPIYDGSSLPIGVLDLDSHEVGAFTETDITGLQQLLRAARLS